MPSRRELSVNALAALALLGLGGVAAPRDAHGQADTSALPARAIGTIAAGQTRGGVLEAGDWTMSDGTWADIWYVNATAGQRVVVETTSRQFPVYIQLLDPWGNKLAEEAGGNSARISYTAREAGRYQVVVNSYSDMPRGGSYTVAVR
jgi:hypothetical protein